jgi:predicted glycosyltransferase
MRLVQLPPVRSDGAQFSSLLDQDGRPVAPALLDARRQIGVDALRAAEPDVVITELFPFGRRALAQEFDALVEAARAPKPRPLMLGSVRDVLVAPEKPDRVAEAHRRLTTSYDGVLVHGDPELVRLDDSWPLDHEIRRLIHYTGYVDEGPAAPLEAPSDGAPGTILVSGGSSSAALPLYRAAIGAAHLVPEQTWRILVGRGIQDEIFAALGREAGSNVRLERARPDFRALLACAALSVSQAGYNTAVDLLRAAVPAILVPFEAGRETEQRLRAEKLAARGLARVLPEAELSPKSLAESVALELASASPAARPRVDLNGAAQSVAIVEGMLARREASDAGPLSRPSLASDRLDWSPLDRALERAADQGRSVAVWWRDDDAAAATPALDRLLALRARYAVPLAIAAIPAVVEPSLPERLASEPRTTVLVHGLAHHNHARTGDKRAEFGPQRPAHIRARDAARALAVAQAAFGSSLRPVFVPPWNRMAPDFAPALREIGYAAVSAFADGRERGGQEPLPRLDTHLDPIDWRGTRSLADPNGLIARLGAYVDASAGRAEPLGLLTHHLVQDAATWAFCEALLARLALRPTVMASVDDLLAAKLAHGPDSLQPAIVKRGDHGYTG